MKYFQDISVIPDFGKWNITPNLDSQNLIMVVFEAPPSY